LTWYVADRWMDAKICGCGSSTVGDCAVIEDFCLLTNHHPTTEIRDRAAPCHSQRPRDRQERTEAGFGGCPALGREHCTMHCHGRCVFFIITSDVGVRSMISNFSNQVPRVLPVVVRSRTLVPPS
jgi:hypothetical protein